MKDILVCFLFVCIINKLNNYYETKKAKTKNN